MLIGFSARSRSRIERRAFFAKSSSVRDRPTAGGFEMMLPDQRAGVAIWRIGVTICAETSARWPARCFRSRPGCCERPRGSRDQCGLPGLFLPIASIFANAARRCSSRNLPMPSSAAVGLSWFVCRRMVCSIVESAAARINDLSRCASALSSLGSGNGRVRISRLQSRARPRRHSSFSPGDMESNVGGAVNSLGMSVNLKLGPAAGGRGLRIDLQAKVRRTPPQGRGGEICAVVLFCS
jgi:hypothetical protein